MGPLSNEIPSWLADVAAQERLVVERIPFDQSAEWTLTDQELRHRTGRFFSIIGVRSTGEDGIAHQPLIKQTERGAQVFLTRRNGDRVEFLLHAKVEPGNVNGAQIAPTLQATASNLDRVHGGDAPPFAWLVQKAEPSQMTLQSEQGTRFFGKLNRNCLITIGDEDPELTELHRWVDVDVLLHILRDDFVVNTDARSVLATTDWRRLVPWEPFSNGTGIFAEALRDSYATEPSAERIGTALADLRSRREQASPVEIVPLASLEGWQVTPDRIGQASGGEFAVVQIAVEATTREVRRWDQPIVNSLGEALVDLYCAQRDGVLKFLFRPFDEPGLAHRIEFGPSRQVAPGETADPIEGDERMSLLGSDEGSRFLEDVARYRIVEVDGDQGDGHWLTLSEVNQLSQQGGIFTNECRSAISVLLSAL